MGNFLNSDMVSVRDLFTGKTYLLEYYQRNYDWQESNINDMLTDFSIEHDKKWTRSGELLDYYLGPIIISKDSNSTLNIVDGQQRLTSLTLMLLFLKNKIESLQSTELYSNGHNYLDLITVIKNTLYTIQESGASWVMNHEKSVLDVLALIDKNALPLDSSNIKSPSAINVMLRYADIENFFDSEMNDAKKSLEFFVSFSWWVLDRVRLNQITSASTEQAYKIFETQNDRGLSLAPFDMLKAFLLSRISDSNSRDKAAKSWESTMSSLASISQKYNDRKTINDFFRDLLRARYATKESFNTGEYDKFASEYHRWVEKNLLEIMDLKNQEDILNFLTEDLPYYANAYLAISKATSSFNKDMSSIYFNSRQSYALQHMIILSALNPSDSLEERNKKIAAVALFIEIYITREFWAGRSWKPNYTKFIMVNVMETIRNISNSNAKELESKLYQILKTEHTQHKSFGNPPVLTDSDKKFIRTLLARMTDEIEQVALNGASALGANSRFNEFLSYDIEHIMANKFEQQWSEHYPTLEEFTSARNKMGALVLLDGRTNQSLQDKPYKEKVKDYVAHGPYLAKILSKENYDEGGSLKSQSGWQNLQRFSQTTGIAFKPYEEFDKVALTERDTLYRKLAEIVWSPDKILTHGQTPIIMHEEEVEEPEPQFAAEKGNNNSNMKLDKKLPASSKVPNPTLKDLIDSGILNPGEITSALTNYPGTAELLQNGKILVNNLEYSSPSTAAVMHAQLSNPSYSSANGWISWYAADEEGNMKLLEWYREEFKNMFRNRKI